MKFNLKLILLSKVLWGLNMCLMLSTGFVVLHLDSEAKGRKLSKLNEGEFIANPMLDWKLNYEKTIEFLKKHEGFADGKAYICPGGYKTIGYGHVILEGENFEQLTEKQADSLLRSDFDKALRAVDKTVKLPASKRLAMAHFVFAKGIGTFINSGLRDKISKGEAINETLMEFCYYTDINGKRIKSQNAIDIRKWELDLFYLKS